MSLQDRWEPRFSSQLQGHKILSEGCVRRIHTHTLYFLPAFTDVPRHRYPFVILIPLFFCLFLSSFGYKPASRRKQLSSRAASYTNFTMTLKKYTQIYRQNCPKMIKYSFYKISTVFSNRNGTMERNFLPRPKT